MAFQTNANRVISFKAQSTLGTEEASGSGATKLSYKSGSQGLSANQKAVVQSAINKGDGQLSKARLGSIDAPLAFTLEAVVGAHEDLYAGLLKKAADAAVTITDTEMASDTIAVASSVITATGGGGSWITEGLRVGDFIKFASGLDAADNGKWLRVTALTATTITVAETITDVAGPVSSYSLTRPKRYTQGTSPSLFTFEDYYADIDASLVTKDVRLSSGRFVLSENNTLDVPITLLGTNAALKASGSAPHFTSPTEKDGNPLAFLDACLYINGADRLDVTGFDIGIDVGGQTLAVANKTGISPDVFVGNGAVTGNFSMAMQDTTFLAAADAETRIEFQAMFLDPNGTDVFGLYCGNCTLAQPSLSAISDNGAAIQTFQLLIGRDERGGAYDETSIKLLSSAA